ncbi:MAG: phage antirepressor N-terminal domain-containing protein [Bacteroidales bacterium]
METKTTAIAKVNDVDILIIEGDEKRVALKPICDALGIDYSTQVQRIKDDPILGSTVGLSPTVGADEKQREMVTIPFKFVFGWLFRIDSRNVKEESRESVLKYQLHCYNALYNSLFQYVEFVEYRANRVEAELEKYEEAVDGFKFARNRMNDAKLELNHARHLTYEVYLQQLSQLKLNFSEETEANNA